MAHLKRDGIEPPMIIEGESSIRRAFNSSSTLPESLYPPIFGTEEKSTNCNDSINSNNSSATEGITIVPKISIENDEPKLEQREEEDPILEASVRIINSRKSSSLKPDQIIPNIEITKSPSTTISKQNRGWNTRSDNLLKAFKKHCQERFFAHRKAAKFCKFLNWIIGFPSIIIGSFVACTLITVMIDRDKIPLWFLIVVTVLGIISSILSGLQPFLGFDREHQLHLTTSNEYSTIIRRIQIEYSFEWPQRTERREFFHTILNAFDKIVEKEISIPNWIKNSVIKHQNKSRGSGGSTISGSIIMSNGEGRDGGVDEDYALLEQGLQFDVTRNPKYQDSSNMVERLRSIILCPSNVDLSNSQGHQQEEKYLQPPITSMKIKKGIQGSGIMGLGSVLDYDL